MIAKYLPIRKFIPLSSFFFLVISFSSSQTYNFENFSVEDGLAQNQILSMCQDDRGYIWFGTNNGGVSIYNGTKFKTLTQTDGLVSNVIFSIMQGKNGKIFFGTNGGLSVYNGRQSSGGGLSESVGSFTNYTSETGLPHNYVFCMQENESGEMVLGTDAGVVKLSEGKIVPFTEDRDSVLKNTAVFSMFKDRKGNFWFGTKTRGAIKYDYKQNQFTTISTANGLDHNFVRAFVEDKDGNMWIGTAKGLNKIIKSQVNHIRLKENETTLTFTSGLLSKDGNLWFGTQFGLAKYSSNGWLRYNEINGLVSNTIWSILEDREGNIWIGTMGKGVAKFRYKGEVFRNFSIKNNLPNDIVQAIYQDKKGDYWIGSQSGIARMKKDGTVETFPKTLHGTKLWHATNTYSITEDNEGNTWFATLHEDVACYVFDGKQFIAYSAKDGFSHNIVNSAMRDRQGILWFGTQRGVTKKEGKNISILPGTEKNNVWWILQDNKSHYWLGTETGVIKYDGSSFQYFTKKDGLVDGRVRTIVQDAHRTYWFATDEGVFSYDSKSFHKIDQAAGLSSNTVYSLLLDGNYSLWIGTNKGLNRLNIDRFFETKDVVIKHYGKDEGFIGLECNANAAYKDNKGHLWFGTVKGVTIFNPEMETVNTSEPITHITNLRLDFNNFNWTQYADSIDDSGFPINLKLPYNKNHLTFDFVGVSLTIPQKVKYQYKLEPLETSFTPPNFQNEAVYPHLPPGEYKFILKAKNNDDYWNSKPVEYSFTILPPWYQTWWFYSLCVLSLVAGVWSFILMREKNLRKQKQNLEMQVQERTSELREEKEKVEQINLEVLEKNKIIEHKNKDITDSITYAQGIQEAILPPDEKFKKYLPDSFILFRPRDIVSGDFYWMEVAQLADEKNEIQNDNVNPLSNNSTNHQILVAVCDCTGHGVPGGFVSMVGHNGLTRTVNEQGIFQPAKILDRASLMVEETFLKGKRKDGMDAVLCGIRVIENKTELDFAGANNPLYILRKKENGILIKNGQPLEPDIFNETHLLFQISPDKQPVGAYEFRQPFTNHCFNLLAGDTVILSSDGFRDQFGGPKGKKFMAKNFKQTLLSIQNFPMEEQKEILNKTINTWMSHCEQNDDICIIGVRI